MLKPAERRSISGVCVALCTPLTADGSQIDTGRLKDHIDDVIAAGVHGIAPCSGTGEYAYLSETERRQVLEISVHHAAGRVPIVAQASGMATADVIEKAIHAEAQGVDALMIMPPDLEIPGPEAIV